MFKPKIRAFYRCCWGLGLLLPSLLNAQVEKNTTSTTSMLEKRVIDADYASQYHDYHIKSLEIGVITMRDAFVSPLLLEGSGFRYQYDHLRYTPQALKQLSTGVFSGLAVNQSNDFNLMLLSGAVQYSWQFPLLEKNNWKFYAGPWAQGFGNLRFALQNVNNIIGYDAGLDVGPIARAEVKFTPPRNEFRLTQQLSIPLVSAFVRPLYTFTAPIIGETDNDVSIFQVGTLNRRFGWMYKASLDFYRRHKHKKQIVTQVPYRLSYTFQYDQFSKPNPGQTVIQTISISKILKY